MIKKIIFFLIVLLSVQTSFSETKIINLKVDNYKNPLGIESKNCSFSWQIMSNDRAIIQHSYRIIVSSSDELLKRNEGDIWDSGEQVSDQSLDIPFKGLALKSGKRYFWKVFVRIKNSPHIFSSFDLSFFEMGLLEPKDWQASWIRAPRVNSNWRDFAVARETDLKDSLIYSAPYFRRDFKLKGNVKEARLYISGIGYNVLYLNGSKVGDQVLDPAFTRYDKTVLYRIFDVTNHLKIGGNTIAIILGNGWYNMQTRTVWGFDLANWKAQPKLLAQLEITYGDGTKELILSDHKWKTSSSPIFFNSVFQGEYYDARKEIPEWNKQGFDDRSWNPVITSSEHAGHLKNQLMPPIRELNVLKPISIKEIKKNQYVLNFGKNISGYVRLKMKNKSGTQVKILYGERLFEDGSLNQNHISMYSLDKPFQTDRYIFKGDGIETWSPNFTYHGFQYMQIEGLDHAPTADEITAVEVHTDFKQIGSFLSSNALLNKIVENTENSYLSNFHGYPTDCPHREKNGWTGDAHLIAEMGLLYFDSSSGYKKWIADFFDEQQDNGEIPGIIPTAGWGYFFGNGPAWDGSLYLIPWYVYKYNGDISLMKDAYPYIKKYVDFLSTKADKDLIVNWGLGDWCPAGTETPFEITSTAYYYKAAETLTKMAKVLGNKVDAERYAELSKQIYAAFNKRFYQGEGIYGNGSQTALSCAIYQGLAQDNLEKTVQALVQKIQDNNYFLDFGILGSKYVLHALSENGYADVAYKMVNKKTFPSWGYWIEQGATTLWERWDGKNSRNHPMFGDVSAWLMKTMAGLQVIEDAPGFKKFLIKPSFFEEENCSVTHMSRYGEILIDWKKTGKITHLKIQVPCNTSAIIALPIIGKKQIKEGNSLISKVKEISNINTKEGVTSFEIPSGQYQFTFNTK